MHIGMRKSSVAVTILILLASLCQITASQQDLSRKVDLGQVRESALGFPTGWSDDVQLSNSTYGINSNCPSIAFDNGFVHTIWIDSRPKAVGPGWESKLSYRRSTNIGMAWTVLTNLTEYNGIFGFYPKFAFHQSNLHLIWDDTHLGGREVMYRNSMDNGQTWSNEVLISPADGKASQNPSIACSGSQIYVVWEDYRSNSQYNIYYKRSMDGGITWDDGLGNVGLDRQLSFTTSPSSGNGPFIASDGNGIVHVIYSVWTTDYGRWETMYIRSTDNGATWSAPVMLTTHDSFHSAGRAISTNGSGGIHVVWMEPRYVGGGYEIGYRNSMDDGNTWNPEQRLTFDPNRSDQPALATNGSHVFVTWIDDRDHYDWVGSTSGAYELYYRESFDGGATWGNDTRLTYAVNNSLQPCVAMDANYIHVAWTDNRTDGSKEQIFYKRYPDFPDTTPPTHSNEMPIPDSYKDPPGTTISVRITDSSGVNASSIKLYVNGSLVAHSLTPITNGYNVSYVSPGYESGVIACRIVANDTLGNHLDYTWSFTVLNSFKIPVVAGWNLISMPLVQPNSNLPSVLQDRDGDTLWDRAMSYNASDINDRWKQYNAGWSGTLNDLTAVSNRVGVWLNVTNVGDGFLNVTGLLPTTSQITLRAGWNLVGYPTLSTSMTVANALWGTGADIVEVFDQSATYRTKVVGPNYVMKPGEAYWVHCAADSVWTVNW